MTEEVMTFDKIFQEKLRSQWFTKKGKKKYDKVKLSPERRKTGFKRTRRAACHKCVQKFIYQYSYYDAEVKRQRHLTSTDFFKLRAKVKAKNLLWEVEDSFYAAKTAKEVGFPLKDLL